jgi:hypothetical protein
MAVFEEVTPRALAVIGTSSAADQAHARIAWRYFQNNTHPTTGLVNSTDKYPSTTMWETGSYFVAVISANRLGVIDRDEAVARIGRALDTLYVMRLFDDMLPNKAYACARVIWSTTRTNRLNAGLDGRRWTLRAWSVRWAMYRRITRSLRPKLAV